MIDEPRDPRQDDERLGKGKESKPAPKTSKRTTSESDAGAKRSSSAAPKRAQEKVSADELDESIRETQRGDRGEVL